MGLPHLSLSTTDDVELINLSPTDISPLMSKCEIKVLYIGENRNNSFISKDVATEMAKSLRGCPIVGYFRKEKEDFADHGHKVTMDDQGVHFECMTQPYGFVDPTSKVWFQKFNDVDDFGNEIEREYLCVQGYVWTGQYEEANVALEDGGRPHSMELDEKTFQGHWAENSKNGLEFFIISDALFSKLCILGEDVEPCYEGSSITTPTHEFTVNNNDKFIKTLFSMMTDLQFALNAKGVTMENVENQNPEVQEAATPAPEATGEDTSFTEGTTPDPNATAGAEPEVQTGSENEFAKDKKEEEEKSEDNKEENKEDDKKDESKEEKKEDEEDKKKKDYSLEFEALKKELDELKTSFAALEAENKELKEFKVNTENAAKDKMIAEEFYMLSDADKAEVIEHKTEYTLDELKSKLATICFDKKVAFNKEESEEAKEQPAVTFNLNDAESNVPEWVQAVRENM
jgi:hypothetical protein